MNKIYVYVLLFVVPLLASCSKDYLDTKPTDEAPTPEVFANIDNVWAALNGIHRAMYYSYDYFDETGMTSVMLHSDFLGEDVVMANTGNGWYVNTYRWRDHASAQGYANKHFYKFFYEISSNANKIIENIDGVIASAAEKNAIKGQALAYRAWAHFMLVQSFGKAYGVSGSLPIADLGVPIQSSSKNEARPRSTVKQVYDFINQDLTDAIALLASAPVLNKSNLNLYTVQGIKARVALTMHDWAAAATAARDAINTATADGISLMSVADYNAGFNDYENAEWMWGSRVGGDQGLFFASYFAFIGCNFSSTNIRTCPKLISQKLYDVIPTTDIRKGMWKDTVSSAASYTAFFSGVVLPSNWSDFTKMPYMTRKFWTADPSVSNGDVPYMRLAEMYLIEAEALARDTRETDAHNSLFTLVSQRDPAYTLSTNVGAALINEILLQRRIELWGEGFSYQDLKRTGAALDRTGSNHVTGVAVEFSIPASDNRWQFAFPQREVDTNPNIVQNP